MKEAFEQVAKDEARKLSIVQEITMRSTDYLRRIIAPVGGQGGVTMSNLARIVTVSRWKTTFGGSREQSVEKNMTGRNRTRFWSCKQWESVNQTKVSRAHAVPQGLCENLINALKLPAKTS